MAAGRSLLPWCPESRQTCRRSPARGTRQSRACCDATPAYIHTATTLWYKCCQSYSMTFFVFLSPLNAVSAVLYPPITSIRSSAMTETHLASVFHMHPSHIKHIVDHSRKMTTFQQGLACIIPCVRIAHFSFS